MTTGEIEALRRVVGVVANARAQPHRHCQNPPPPGQSISSRSGQKLLYRRINPPRSHNECSLGGNCSGNNHRDGGNANHINGKDAPTNGPCNRYGTHRPTTPQRTRVARFTNPAATTNK
jgi:hypothetical protein